MKTLFAIIVGLAAQTCFAAESRQQVSLAAAVLNVARFVYWPVEGAGAEECMLCFSGDDTLAAQLQALEGRRLHGRRLRVQRLSAPGNALRCQILVLPDGAADLHRYIDAVALRPVLTIGEQPRFLDAGGNIAILRNETGMKLTVNLASTQRNGLRVNAQLMRVATVAASDGRR